MKTELEKIEEQLKKFDEQKLNPLAPALAVIFVSIFWAALIAVQQACAPVPPTVVTPEGIAAWQNLQIQTALDTLRDVAIEANQTHPPVLPEATTRKVVLYHKAAIVTLHERQNGWQATLRTGADQLLVNLPEKERTTLQPYVTLVLAVITEVSK